MGSSQSVLSSEAAVAIAVIAGAIGLGYGHLKPPSTNSSPATPQHPPQTTASGKKGKKKKQSVASLPQEGPSMVSAPTPAAAPASNFIPGEFAGGSDSAPAERVPPPKPSKGKKKKKNKPPVSEPSTLPQAITSPGYDSESSSVAGPRLSALSKGKEQSLASSSTKAVRPLRPSVSIDTEGSWTRVESGRRKRRPASTSDVPSADVMTGDAGTTSPVSENSSPITERTEDEAFLMRSRASTDERRPLAERLLPKARKTGVDDMLETPDHPTLSRVMRVQPRPDEKPASGFSWADYEDVQITDAVAGENDADGEEDGWGVVKNKKRSKTEQAPSSSHRQIQKAPEAMTKRQRQNARNREMEKTAKAEAEQERLATLGKHKHNLEKERMLEQFGKSGGRKLPSGGMKAAVDEGGKLVWE